MTLASRFTKKLLGRTRNYSSHIEIMILLSSAQYKCSFFLSHRCAPAITTITPTAQATPTLKKNQNSEGGLVEKGKKSIYKAQAKDKGKDNNTINAINSHTKHHHHDTMQKIKENNTNTHIPYLTTSP